MFCDYCLHHFAASESNQYSSWVLPVADVDVQALHSKCSFVLHIRKDLGLLHVNYL